MASASRDSEQRGRAGHEITPMQQFEDDRGEAVDGQVGALAVERRATGRRANFTSVRARTSSGNTGRRARSRSRCGA